MIFCVQIITMKFCEEKSEQASSYFYFNIITGAQHDFVCECECVWSVKVQTSRNLSKLDCLDCISHIFMVE